MPRILFIGDIVGRPGRNFVQQQLAALKADRGIDLVIANAENSAGGSGVSSSIAGDLFEAGVDAITLGDHVWGQKGFDAEIDRQERICRPVNLPDGCPGKTFLIVETNGFRLGIFTLLGHRPMKVEASSSPFPAADKMINELKRQVDALFVEIHAETTSEKIALGWYLDGRVAAVVGTHTHVPTADERILPRGTAYITDVGMTGPYESVLGRSIASVIARFVDGMPRRLPVAENDVRLCGCLVDIHPEKGIATSMERICLRQLDLAPESLSDVL
ncbi:MAG: TIGR00282 family metallophosphoesterase [Opitutales bacterium]|nr:TIGR00282 family metallophosphoesterase [Opitutales bacterium]